MLDISGLLNPRIFSCLANSKLTDSGLSIAGSKACMSEFENTEDKFRPVP